MTVCGTYGRAGSEMPASGGLNDRLLVEAVENGTLPEEVLNDTARRLLTLILKLQNTRNKVSSLTGPPTTGWQGKLRQKAWCC